jgi:hypothetical protein
MKKQTFILLGVILLTSCLTEQNNSDIKDVNEETYSISASGDLNTLREKLKTIAILDTLQYGEIELYDDFYKDKITKLFISADDKSSRLITIVTYNDIMRFKKVLLNNEHNLSDDEMLKSEKKYKSILRKMIENNYFREIEKNYYEQKEEGDTYATAMLVSKSTLKKNYIGCYIYSAPIKEINYLKHMIKNAFKTDTLGLYMQFVTQE